MDAAPIPFNGPDSGLDELSGSRGPLVNLLVDAAGGMRLRPGIAAWDEFPPTVPDANPVVAMTVWQNKLVYVTQSSTGTRKLYAWTSYQNVEALSDSTTATQLEGAERPRITTTRTKVILAGGGAMLKYTGSGLAALLGGSPPALVTDVLVMTQRVVALEAGEGGLFYWSAPGDGNHETWTTSEDFREAEARPDKIVAIRDSARELFVWGSETLQVYGPDPNEVFAPINNMDLGCLARHSIIRHDEQFAWLDSRRRFVMSDGRAYEAIGTPATDRLVAELASVTDCWGSRVRLDDRDLLLWVFPTDGRAFAYDMTTKVWSEWRGWSSGNWAGLTIQSHVYWPEKNVNLVGLSDGTIAKLDLSTYTDSGTAIHWLARSGFVDHENASTKATQKVQFHVRRGESTDTAEPFFLMRWRDDLGTFSGPLQVGLGTTSTRPFATVEKWSIGKPYLHRQWEIYGSSNALVSIAKVIESFDTMEEA